MNLSYLDNPQHVIHASVLDELPPTATANSGLIVRYTCPEHPQPIIRELWLDDIRIINLSYQTNQALPLDFIPQRPLRKKWGVGEAQIAMPLHFN